MGNLVLLALLTLPFLVAIFFINKIALKALDLSIEAKVHAEGLAKSTVIQRIVEKYHPSSEEGAKKDVLKEMDEILDSMSAGIEPDTENGKLRRQVPNDILPEDVV